MLEKVGTKEIENIKNRLEAELEDKNLPSQKKVVVESLISHLTSWLEFREYWERKHYREVDKRES